MLDITAGAVTLLSVCAVAKLINSTKTKAIVVVMT
jgi:hypothetical protein